MTLPLSHAIPVSFYGLVKSVEGQGGKQWKMSPYSRRKPNHSSVVVILTAVCISISAPKYASSARSCVCWARRCLRWHQFGSVRSHEGIVNHVHEGGNVEKINLLGFSGRPWKLLGLPYWCLVVGFSEHLEGCESFLMLFPTELLISAGAAES